ncbi:MAG: GNAT family N-acetyltransferase [Mucilaginibacter polytrichastri]|nr:GNAT family N-acetyltransferase [Mucilaginibacter polytrichastri]
MENTSIKRTDSDDLDFLALVRELDAYLAVTDGNEHSFYAQYNKVDLIKNVVVLYAGALPVACGAIKKFDDRTMEIKRMYTAQAHRGQGLAGQILRELERWTTELGFEKCILETGKRQTDAIKLYEKSGYIRTENYGQYIGVANSVCFEKILIPGS